MTRWFSTDALARHLAGYPPIGLRLRAWFHARTAVDPQLTIEAPCDHDFDEGLGEVWVWSGLVGSTPFAIRSMVNPLAGFGFEVCVPARLDGDRANLEILETIAGSLPAWWSAYFEQLPIAGGFAVVDPDDDTPLYSSADRDDALAVRAFLHRRTLQAFTVVPVGASPAQWLVMGPTTGPYISRLELMPTEEDARRQAARWSAETGAAFEVRQRPSEPL